MQLVAKPIFHRSQHHVAHEPAVVATQLIASRPQQSNANVTRSGSPLSQRNKKPSEHQRSLLRATATLPAEVESDDAASANHECA